MQKGCVYMTYKQAETSREIRLWIGQIIVPAITAAVTIFGIPKLQERLNKPKNVYEFNRK